MLGFLVLFLELGFLLEFRIIGVTLVILPFLNNTFRTVDGANCIQFFSGSRKSYYGTLIMIFENKAEFS